MSVVLITGCSSGIGRATALHLARRGDRVYATMRRPEESGESLRVRAEEEDLDLRLLRLDVTDDARVAEAVATVLEESGQVDVLVNNAGVGWVGTVEETSLDRARTTMEVNYLGVVRMIRAVLPGMRERGSGTIVNISSVSGRLASSALGHYCASKFAVEALSESLAQELYALGVRVVVVEPGFIRTPILDKVGDVPEGSLEGPYVQEMERRLAMFARAREIADPPEAVAEGIRRALDDREPRLRYEVGESAGPALRGRERVSDEEWIALGRKMSPEEYGRELARIFGED